MDVQNLEKNQRNKIIKELCDQGAGFRQLARITGISYGIIQRVVTDQNRPLICDGGVYKVFEREGGNLKRIGTADENLNIFKK